MMCFAGVRTDAVLSAMISSAALFKPKSVLLLVAHLHSKL